MRSWTKRFLDCFGCWDVPEERGLFENPQVILTQACGDLANGNTSQINVRIAEEAEYYHRMFELPVFAQGEVAAYLTRVLKVPVAGKTENQTTLVPFNRKYLTTYDVAKLQKEFCDQRLYTKVLVVQYSPHVWRVIWVYEKLGLKVSIPPKLPEMIFEPGLVPKRLSTPWRFYLFELAARLDFLRRGYI